MHGVDGGQAEAQGRHRVVGIVGMHDIGLNGAQHTADPANVGEQVGDQALRRGGQGMKGDAVCAVGDIMHDFGSRGNHVQFQVGERGQALHQVDRDAVNAADHLVRPGRVERCQSQAQALGAHRCLTC